MTPFEGRPIGTELGLCQRYYEKTYDINVIPGTVTVSGGNMNAPEFRSSGSTYNPFLILYKNVKRSLPTVKVYNPNTGTIDSVYNSSTLTNINLSSIISNTVSIFLINIASAVTNGNAITFHFTADSEL